MAPSLKPLLVSAKGPLASPAGASLRPASFIDPPSVPEVAPPSDPLPMKPLPTPLSDVPLAVEPADEPLSALDPLPCIDPVIATLPLPPVAFEPVDPPLEKPLEAPALAADPEPLPAPVVPESEEHAAQAKPATASTARPTQVRTLRGITRCPKSTRFIGRSMGRPITPPRAGTWPSYVARYAV